MLLSYEEGRVVLEVPQLRNIIVAVAARKYISKIAGVQDVNIRRGVITIDYDPAVLPTRELLARGQADLAKYGVKVEIPPEMIAKLP